MAYPCQGILSSPRHKPLIPRQPSFAENLSNKVPLCWCPKPRDSEKVMSGNFQQQRDSNNYLESFSNSISLMCPCFIYRDISRDRRSQLNYPNNYLKNKTTGQTESNQWPFLKKLIGSVNLNSWLCQNILSRALHCWCGRRLTAMCHCTRIPGWCQSLSQISQHVQPSQIVWGLSGGFIKIGTVGGSLLWLL